MAVQPCMEWITITKKFKPQRRKTRGTSYRLKYYISDSWGTNISGVIYHWDNFPGGQFTSGRQVIRKAVFLRGNFQGDIVRGQFSLGAIVRGQIIIGVIMRGQPSRGKLSGGQLTGWQFSMAATFRTPSLPLTEIAPG